MQATRPSLLPPTSRALRLLLAVLLALAPLLSLAQPVPMRVPANPPEVLAPTSGAMPCHDMHTDDMQATADCPHCSGDAPMSQCECCENVAPAGVVLPLVGNVHTPTDSDHYVVHGADALPPADPGRLYRPPIRSS